MQLLEHFLVIIVAWWLLSLLFRRISSPMGPVVRWTKRWTSRGWHRLWKDAWDLAYRKPAQQRGVGFGIFWLGTILYGFFALSVLHRGEGYDKLFMFGLALGLFKFVLSRYKGLLRSQRPLPTRRKRRFRR